MIRIRNLTKKGEAGLKVSYETKSKELKNAEEEK